MDATVNVVDLTAVMPGELPIAQFYTYYGTAFGDVGDRDGQLALRKLLQFRHNGQKSRSSRQNLYAQYKTLRSQLPVCRGFPRGCAARMRSSCISGS
ncbi:hypothetical protein K4039_28785 [Lyngbya sp. CCAP 1446/10]|uniref:hypothetical protein n=1 Tax=Microcoleaceae TaxID=1892252 RepID=UPI002237D3AF|nr:hypothetical protein [Lyngbya sp. CCAP 1446/10]MCW6053941.1 hypothetical protein [Lyngbya sp. CCAP 1446/10]